MRQEPISGLDRIVGVRNVVAHEYGHFDLLHVNRFFANLFREANLRAQGEFFARLLAESGQGSTGT